MQLASSDVVNAVKIRKQTLGHVTVERGPRYPESRRCGRERASEDDVADDEVTVELPGSGKVVRKCEQVEWGRLGFGPLLQPVEQGPDG
jgi:hypothetical protein